MAVNDTRLRLYNIFKWIDWYFIIAPLIGIFFIGVSIYFKIINMDDIYDYLNFIFNVLALVTFSVAYFLVFQSFIETRRSKLKDLESSVSLMVGNKKVAYTMISAVYYLYALSGAFITAFYNPIVILVIVLSIAMLLLIPGIKHYRLIAIYCLIYLFMAIAQGTHLLRLNPGQISINIKGMILIGIYVIKLIIALLFIVNKTTLLRIVIEEEDREEIDTVSLSNITDPAFLEAEKHLQAYELDILRKMLSDKQYKIGVLILTNYSYKEIARIINIAVSTVQTHSGRIFEKFEVKNRNAFVKYFYPQK